MITMFKIYLENGDIYMMEIGFSFHMYKIKNGYLYNGFKKLGKIKGIEVIG